MKHKKLILDVCNCQREKNKSPNFYIWFSLYNQKHKRMIKDLYNKIIPKDDHHFGFKKFPLKKDC